MDLYKISSTGLSINYMPQYVAEERGIFKALNIEVETYIPDPWPKVLDDIDSGKYAAVCGGIWVPSMYLAHNVARYKVIAKISSRCPFKLVARESKKFAWRDLEGKTVLVPCDGGASAYIFLLGTLKQKGVDTQKVRFVHDFVGSMLLKLFAHGTLGDYILAPAVNADAIADKGQGTIVSEMAVDGGPVPWSVYYSTLEFSEENKDLNKRFALGIQRGLQWMHEHEANDVADIIRKLWPSSNIQTGVETVQRFLKEGMWSHSIDVEDEEFNRYAEYQVAAGILDHAVSKNDLMDLEVIKYVKQYQST